MTRPAVPAILTALLLTMAGDRWDTAHAQDREAEPFVSTGLAAIPLPDSPVTYETAERQDIRVSVVTAGLTFPWGMTFYAGDRLPAWRGDLFVGALRVGRVDRTGHLQRIGFNRAGQE